MRKIIAALQVSVDGFIEGPNGELDWVDTWEDPFDLSHQIDACILGAGMYPGYEQYWRAILANPEGILPFTGRVAIARRDRIRALCRPDTALRPIDDAPVSGLADRADHSKRR